MLDEPEVNGTRVTVNGTTETWADTIRWDWGDGNTEDARFPATHIYAQPGEYTVTVTVNG
ncbi:MAG: PKD domain-containing protein, partial [Acidimicrobiia bacterium]